MYRVTVCFFVRSRQNYALLRHDLELPFIPYLGLTIEEGEWSATLIEVTWNVDDRRFVCFVAPDETNLHDPGCADFDQRVAAYKSCGWS